MKQLSIIDLQRFVNCSHGLHNFYYPAEEGHCHPLDKQNPNLPGCPEENALFLRLNP